MTIQMTPQPSKKSGTPLRWADHAWIAVLRIFARIGRTGSLGLVAMLVSSIYGAFWLQKQRDEKLAASQSTVQTRATQPTRVNAPEVSIPPPSLPRMEDSLALLKKIKHITKVNGLSWSQADYHFTPISSDSLAYLEVSTTLKGPYVDIRQVISDLLDQEPALGLRELTVSRPNGEAAEVEAKVRWVIFMADGWLESGAPKKGPP